MPFPFKCLVLLLLVLAAQQPLAFAQDVVSTASGKVSGTTTDDDAIRIYKGIPYALPPVGERRWQAPQPVANWDGTYAADNWPAHCMQGPVFGTPLVTRSETMSEDCLYLNVWTPAGAGPDARLPVFFVIHGGGFAAGSASEPRTDGEWFARQGIVVVEANYRLNVFGFLAHPELSAESDGKGSGNYGMLDQVAALRWVRDNIASFGGNPHDITINGESAGSMSVSALMASPLTRDLVHKAIGQSGAFFASPTGGMREESLEQKEQKGLAFARTVDAGSLAELREQPAEKLLETVMAAGGWGYSPGVDGYFLETPVAEIFAAGEQADIPLLAGWTSSELGMSIAFNPEKPTVETFPVNVEKQLGDMAAAAIKVYPGGTDEEAMQSAADLASDLFITYSTWKWIEVHGSTSEADIYRYRFDRVVPGDPAGVFGAAHASDIEYAFNTLDSKPASWQAADRATAKVMAQAFARFIKTGNPNGTDVPQWPEFGATGQVMYLDGDSRAGPAEYRERYEFLDSVVEARR